MGIIMPGAQSEEDRSLKNGKNPALFEHLTYSLSPNIQLTKNFYSQTSITNFLKRKKRLPLLRQPLSIRRHSAPAFRSKQFYCKDPEGGPE